MKPQVIGITGGIGSGKSIIARVFSTLGFPVYNSDERAKEMYFVPEVKKEVEAVLGKEAYNSDGSVNKKFIAGKIFSDRQLLEKINGIIHPAVLKDFSAWKEKKTDVKFVFKESALLFEVGIYKSCFKNILVTAPLETRIQRVMQRDGLTHEEVESKIKSQWDDERKKTLADFIINNSGEELVLPSIISWMDSLGRK